MTPSDALALLDIEGSERFVLPGGEDLVPAAALPYDVVVACAEDDLAFIRTVAGGRPWPHREIGRLRAYWVLQQGLVTGNDLRRLCWIVETFSRELEVDLLQRVGVRLADLWQARQWRLLLNLVDHLPRASWTHDAMVNHPEYAEKVADAIARQRLKADPDAPARTSLTEYGPEVAMLAGVIDAVNALRMTLIQVNMPKGKSTPQIPPYPRPTTLVDSMVEKKERALRWTAHERLADRLLTKRQQKT